MNRFLMATSCAALFFVSACPTSDGTNGDGGTNPGGNKNCPKPVKATCAPADVMISPVASYRLAGSNVESIAIADFNGDGKGDIVTSSSSSDDSVEVLLNTGNGTFAAAVKLESKPAGSVIAAADFNNDCNNDIVYSGFGTGSSGDQIELLTNKGNGTFQNPVDFPVTQENWSVLISADVNRDGALDIIYIGVSDNSGKVSISLNNGKGVFSGAVQYDAKLFTKYTPTIAAGDLDGDGAPEIVVPTQNDGVCVLKNNGSGGFAAPVCYASSDNPHANSVAIADVDGDGKLDVALGLSGDNMNIFLGKGDGTLNSYVMYGGLPPFYGPVHLADVNNDGKPDFIAYYGAGGFVNTGIGFNVLLNTGAGKFATTTVLYAAGGGRNAPAYGDLLGNGLTSMAAYNASTNSVDVLLAKCLH